MSEYTLHHGDCLARPMPPADAIIADVPYGKKRYVTDVAFPARVFAQWVETYRTVAIFGPPELLVRWCVQAHISPDEWVTWWPTNKMMARSAKLPQEVEVIAIFGPIFNARDILRPRAPSVYGRKRAIQRGLSPDWARMGDVWRDPSPGVACEGQLRHHPNEKPLSLMERLVTLCSHPGETVIDPCMGSGTTGHACGNLGRRFVGIEKDAGYFAIAQERIATAYEPLRMMQVAV